MDIYPPEIAAAQAAEWLAAAEQTAADAAIAQIRAIPDCVFTPLVMAQLVACLSSKAQALGPNSREVAQGYLDDCYDDMKGFVWNTTKRNLRRALMDNAKIAAAFVKAQKNFAPALKTNTNPAFRSKYVALDGCIEAVIDSLNANGIALLQPTEPTPTDAELLCLIEAHLGLKPRRDDTVIDPRTGRFTDAQRYRDFARAVLAKLGTPPAVAGEPVAVIEFTDGVKEPRIMSWNALPAGQHRVHTTPQPTQPQAGAVPQYRLLHSGVDRIEDDDEFLSDDTTTWAIDPNGIFSGNIYGGHVLRPARRRIKGGQHGIPPTT